MTEGDSKTFAVLVRGKAFDDPNAVMPPAVRHNERTGAETLTTHGWIPNARLPIKPDAKKTKC